MKVVIVGGGFAGIKTALELDGALGLEVVIISKHPEFTFTSVSASEPQHSIIPIETLFEASRNITVIQDTVIALNSKVKAIKTAKGNVYQYDKLVLAIGRDKGTQHIAGVSEYAESVHSPEGIAELYTKLSDLARHQLKTSIRVGIIGGGITGVEIAGGIKEFLFETAKRHGVPTKKLEVELYEANSRILSTLNSQASEYATKRLKRLGVDVMCGTKVTSCTKHVVHLTKTERSCDLIVWAGGSMPSQFFAKYPDVFSQKDTRVVVDEHLRVPASKDIFVIGDSASALYRGMAQSSLHDATHVSQVLKLEVSKPGVTLPPYHVKAPYIVVPIGAHWAIVQKGNKVWHGWFGWTKKQKGAKQLQKHFMPIRSRVPSVM